MSNRVFVAFYSRKGYTRELGQDVCRALEETSIPVACLEFEPEKEVNVLSASASSFTRSSEPIKECQVELDGFNLLILGTPVWGGLPAPYMRSLLERVVDLKGLPVVLFATCAYGDRNASKELRDMVRSSGGRPLEYHVWRIKKEGIEGRKRTAERVVDAALEILPSTNSERLED